MKASNYRTCLMAGSVLALAISGLIHAQQPANLEPVLRELGIMRNIFAGALEQGPRTSKFFGGGPAPDALYLAGQGMVFSFNLPADGFAYDFGGFCGKGCDNFDFFVDDNIVVDIDPPLPPLPPLPAPADVSTTAELQESQRSLQEELRAKEQELRARNDELRALNREMRSLGRAQSSDPDNDNLSAQMDALEATVNELQQNLARDGEAYRQQIQEIQDNRAAAINTQRQQQIDQVLGVLCDYGSTLKALPANENVSLVFRNFAGDTDQVLVMSHAEVAGCTAVEGLKQTAVSYQQ